MPDTQQDEQEGPSDEQLAEIVDKHCIMLSEHFDAVRIFVVKHDGETDLSRALSRGRGNWYAQKAAIDDWVMQQNARTKHDAVEDE